MTKTLQSIIVASISCLILIACSGNDVYNSYVALPNTGWGQDSLAVFRTHIDDASKTYDITFQIRNESNYKYANLWLFVDVISPDGELQRDTAECILAHNDGSWIGGGWGSLYSIQCPYRLNTRFAKTGNYTFRIAHGMREDDIKGIHSLGLRITTKSEEE